MTPSQLAPCMHDHQGALVAEWLPEMQSTEFLKRSIASGHRTAACWDELRQRNNRVQAFRRLLPSFKSTAPARQP